MFGYLVHMDMYAFFRYLSGFYNNVTPSGLLDQTLVNSGFTTETVTYHITPHANGCDGPVTDYIVTVYPSPNLSNNPPSKQICTNTPDKHHPGF